MFNAEDTIGYVLENEAIGTNIMTLSAYDPDLPPNGAPFVYNLIGGKHKSYVSLDKNSGLMRTNRVIDRENTPQLDLLVEVEDSGTPKMRAQHKIIVNILDQNDVPSTPRAAEILVNVFNEHMPNGKIAEVKPNDLDTVGDYKCKILSESNSMINSLFIGKTCELHSKSTTKPRKYSYTISGNDGKHSDVISTFGIDFKFFDNATVENSITIHIENMTGEDFLGSYYRNFIDMISSEMEMNDRPVIYGIRNRNESLDIIFGVQNDRNEYHSSSFVSEKLIKKTDTIAQLLQVPTVIVGYSPCSINHCENNGVCFANIKVNEDSIEIIDSPKLIFSGPSIAYEYECKCADGFAGPKCDKRQDPCSPNPCKSGSVCRRQGFDFQCVCAANREGKLCQLEREAACSSFPCKNGGSCRESPDGSSFFCLCRPGYQGNQCEAVSDSCRPNPCFHGGQCISTKTGYKCSCADGRYGRHCERTTYGFHELSYMTFPSLDASTNDVSIILATKKSNALLLYNYGTQSGGRSDFVALEIFNGKAVFSFGATRTSITSISSGGSSNSLINGRWHKITATRNGRVMSLSVAKCSENGDVCDECRPGDKNCYVDDVGPTG